MTYTRFIGDVHGLKHEFEQLLMDTPYDVSKIIQVGDMGVGFGQSDYWHESLEAAMKAKNCRFIRGNHDNPETCRNMETWIADGEVHDSMMLIGGAWSIDRAYRTAGWNWWPDEEVSMSEFQRHYKRYYEVKPKVMVTHDCPHFVASKLFFAPGRLHYGREQHATNTGVELDLMCQKHKPKVWLFGHWHESIDEVVDGTRFICLNELEYIDINLETMEVRK